MNFPTGFYTQRISENIPYWQCQLEKFQKFQIQKDAVKWMYRFNLNSVRVIGNGYCNEIPLHQYFIGY